MSFLSALVLTCAMSLDSTGHRFSVKQLPSLFRSFEQDEADEKAETAPAPKRNTRRDNEIDLFMDTGVIKLITPPP